MVLWNTRCVITEVNWEYLSLYEKTEAEGKITNSPYYYVTWKDCISFEDVIRLLSFNKQWIGSMSVQTIESGWHQTNMSVRDYKRVLHGLRRWTSTVTDLRKNSRYPGLARAVLFPILLLIVCKKKQTTNYFTVCLSQRLLEFFLHSIWS